MFCTEALSALAAPADVGGGFGAQARKQDEHPEIAAFHEEVRNTSMEMVQARIPAKIIEVHALYKVHQPLGRLWWSPCVSSPGLVIVRVRVSCGCVGSDHAT